MAGELESRRVIRAEIPDWDDKVGRISMEKVANLEVGDKTSLPFFLKGVAKRGQIEGLNNFSETGRRLDLD